MKTKYKIGEVSRLLGITSETIRFYEKEGIIMPNKEESNGYRYYTIQNINELLNVIFYRRIEVPIQDIRNIINKGDFDDMCNLIQSKSIEVAAKIEKQKLMLKKLNIIQQSINDVNESLNQFSVRAFNTCFILMKDYEGILYAEEGISLFAVEHFEFATYMEQFEITNENPSKTCTYLIMDKSIAEDMGVLNELEENEILEYPKCIYTTIAVGSYEVQIEEILPVLDWMKHSDYEMIGNIYCNYIFYSHENSSQSNYVELFIPIN